MRSIDVVQSWFDMCRTGDESLLGELVTAGYLMHGPGGTGDRDAFLAWLRWYSTSFAEQKAHVEDVIEAGDRVVVRYSVVSLYMGGYLDLPPRDQSVRETGIIIFRLYGGKIAESWFEGNDLDVVQQLGGHIGPVAP